MADGEATLLAGVKAIAGSIENIQTSPDFRGRLVRRRDESIVVDLVHERATHGKQPKMGFGSVQVDPPEEILANKLCILLSRAEMRDLLSDSGHAVDWRVDDELAYLVRGTRPRLVSS